MDGCHLGHGPGGGDHRRGGVPVAHAPVSVHGTRGGRVHHRSASPQGTRGPIYRGIKGPTSHLVNQHALNWIVEGERHAELGGHTTGW